MLPGAFTQAASVSRKARPRWARRGALSGLMLAGAALAVLGAALRSDYEVPASAQSTGAAAAHPRSQSSSTQPVDQARGDALIDQIRGLREKGEYAAAIPLARELLELRIRANGEKHWQTGDARRQIETLELISELPGSAQAELAESERDEARGFELRKQEKYPEAIAVYEKCLATRRRLLPAGHFDIGRTIFNLGLLQQAAGQNDAAQSSFIDASQIFLNLYGGTHPNLAACLSQLAATLFRQGKFDKALGFHESALRMRRELYGEHPSVVMSLRDVAGCLYALNRPKDALPLRQEAATMWERLYPAGAADAAERRDNDEQLATLLTECGDCLYATFRSSEALPYYERALSLRRSIYQRAGGAPGECEDRVELATSLYNVGLALQSQSRYEDALRCHQEALAIRRRLCANSPSVNAGAQPGDDPDVAKELDATGFCLSMLNRWDESIERHKAALEMLQRLKPGDSREVASSLSGMAMWLDLRGRAAEAIEYRRQALEMQQRLHQGQDHADVALLLDAVGNSLASLGRREEALKYKQDALVMYQRLEPGDSVLVANALCNVGDALAHLDRPTEARKIFEQSLAMYRRLGTDASWLYLIYSGLANCLVALGEPEEALKYYEELSALARRPLNSTQPAPSVESLRDDVAFRAGNRAAVAGGLLALGKSEEGLKYAQEALGLRRRLYAGDHAEVAFSLSQVAAALQARGWPAEALRHATDALEMRERLFTADQPDLVASHAQVAGFLMSLGRAEEALEHYQAALDMCRRLYSGDHAQLVFANNNLGLGLQALGRNAEALKQFEEALSMYRRLWEGDDWNLAIGLNNIGICLASLGRTEEALAKYQEALAMYRRLWPADHAGTAWSLNNVGACLCVLNRFEEALPYCQQAVEMAERQKYPQGHFWSATLGYIYLRLGRPADAVPVLINAITQIESLRAQAKGLSEDERITYFAMLKGFGAFDTMVRAQMQLGNGEEALRYLEKGRARSLMDLLERSRFDPLEQVARRAAEEHDTAKQERIAQVRAAIAQAELEVNNLEHEIAMVRSRRTEDDEAAKKKQADLEKLFADQRAARVRQRDAGRQWFELVEGVLQTSSPREPKELRGLLGSGERLLVYSVTAGDAVLLVVPPGSEPIRGYPLKWPDGTNLSEDSLTKAVDGYLQGMLRDGRATQRAEAQSELEQLKSVPQPTQAQRGEIDELTQLVEQIDRGSLSVGQAGGAGQEPTAELGARLFAALVPAEVWADIRTAPLVYLVPDGPLHHLPFETLVVAPGENAEQRRYWLDDGPPIGYGQSASALLWSKQRRDEQLAHSSEHAPQYEAVALGDPIFARSAGQESGAALPESGILVLDTPPDSPARAAGLSNGDVITAYDGKPVADDLELQDRVTEIEKAVRRGQRTRDPIKIAIWRAGRQRELSVPPGRLGAEVAAVPPPQALAAIQGSKFDAKTMAAERGNLLTRYGGLAPLPGTRREIMSIYHTLTGRDYAPERPGGERTSRENDRPEADPRAEQTRGLGATSQAATSQAPSAQPAAEVRLLLGEDATVTDLYALAPSARFLHLATHQLADETEFASYSSLALTLPPVISSADNGFLKLGDLLERWRDRLSRCELVVLSACETQRGRLQRDEGVFAMPWGFLYAGAPAVVASLWPVNDVSTAELMSGFYQRLRSSGGESKLSAFAAARRQLRQRYAEPYFWAPFVYIGDAR